MLRWTGSRRLDSERCFFSRVWLFFATMFSVAVFCVPCCVAPLLQVALPDSANVLAAPNVTPHNAHSHHRPLSRQYCWTRSGRCVALATGWQMKRCSRRPSTLLSLPINWTTLRYCLSPLLRGGGAGLRRHLSFLPFLCALAQTKHPFLTLQSSDKEYYSLLFCTFGRSFL